MIFPTRIAIWTHSDSLALPLDLTAAPFGCLETKKTPRSSPQGQWIDVVNTGTSTSWEIHGLVDDPRKTVDPGSWIQGPRVGHPHAPRWCPIVAKGRTLAYFGLILSEF
jgi:hypothetical protein